MHAVRLGLYQFRLYARRYFELSPSVNVFFGPNAQGKTSVLEALFLCSIGKSFRANQLNDLIQRGKEGFCVDLHYEKCGIDQEIKVYGTSSERFVQINGTKQPLSALSGGLTAVASTPDDIYLVKGPPALRRDYLDQQLLQVDPLYSHHLKRYGRALKQRNSLIRAQVNETLDSWEYELAHSAAYLIAVRKEAIEKLSTFAGHIYSALSGKPTPLTLTYKPGVAEIEREQLSRVWKTSRARDMAVGTTLIGPHKDDCLILLDQMDLRHFGSEGEQRSAAIALKLAEWELILSKSEGEKPLLLIDDIGFGLDAQRQAGLMRWLGQAGQVLVTTTHSEQLPLSTSDKSFFIEGPSERHV